MKMFIPDIGFAIRLTEDWTFSLYFEQRNRSLLLEAGAVTGLTGYLSDRDKPPVPHTLKAGTSLVVDRVFIRNGMSDFSSISFIRKADKASKTPKARFWAKLEDVNEMEFERDEDAQYWGITLAEAMRDAQGIQLVPGIEGLGFPAKTPVNFTPKTTETLKDLRGKTIVVTKKGTRAELYAVAHVLQNFDTADLKTKDGHITAKPAGGRYFNCFVDPKNVIGFGEPEKA